MAHRIRGQFANVRVLGDLAARTAVATLAHGPARRWLEEPGWSAPGPAPAGPVLAVEPAEVKLPGCPFQVAAARDGEWIFVSLQRPGGNQRAPGAVAVLRRDGLSFRLERRIELTAAAWGLAWLRDESLLAVANSHGVVWIDARAARRPDADPIVATSHYGRDGYTTQVLASPDGRRLFASDEHGGTVSILDVDRALAGDGPGAVACQVPVDVAPVGMALSPDGRRLHVTCEMARASAPELANWLIYAATLRGGLRRAGVLCTIDLATALDDPARAVVGRAVAGGHPVRVRLSSEGRVAWVTARASDELIAISVDDPAAPGAPRSLAHTALGPSPVGLALLEELDVVLVANSDRFAETGTAATLGVVDAGRALAGEEARIGHVRVGSFPREITTDAERRIVYATNFGSGSLSLLSFDSLERAVEAARAGRGG